MKHNLSGMGFALNQNTLSSRKKGMQEVRSWKSLREVIPLLKLFSLLRCILWLRKAFNDAIEVQGIAKTVWCSHDGSLKMEAGLSLFLTVEEGFKVVEHLPNSSSIPVCIHGYGHLLGNNLNNVFCKLLPMLIIQLLHTNRSILMS